MSIPLKFQKELKKISLEPIEGCNVLLNPDNGFNLTIILDGPPDTIFNGFKIKLDYTILPTYPFKPPIIKFTSKMFHPNISESGELCLDILKDKWTPAYNLPTIIQSILSLLTDPNPDSALNINAANLYKTDIQEYNNKVVTTLKSN